MRLKKFLSVIMTAALLAAVLPIGSFQAGAWKYTCTVSNGKATITEFDVDESINGDITIPSEIGGYPVTAIGNYAFEHCTGLTSITIPDSVTSIGQYAFYGCTGLTSVIIGNSVNSIGEYAFYNCTGLTSITIPDSVTSIGQYAFCGCTGLTSVIIGNSVNSIGKYAFYNCTGLESIIVNDGNTVYHSENNCLIETESKTLVLGCKNSIIPADGSVTSIGGYAFVGCTGLTSIIIPDSVTSIGSYAFEYCTGLTSITIPDSVTSIGSSAFRGCSNLAEITLPFIGDKRHQAGDTYQYPFGFIFGTSSYEGGTATSTYYYGYKGNTTNSTYYIPSSLKKVTITDCDYVQDGAFRNCTGLTSITIPDSVTAIDNFAFYNCTGLESIIVNDGNTVYHSENNCLIKTKNKTLVLGCKNSIIPADGSVTSIGGYAFVGCTGLTSITIPDSVTAIDNFAFYNCTGLTSVTIGNSVTSIGGGAFEYCTGLTSITIPNSVTSIGGGAFEYCTGLTSITIPDSVTAIDNFVFYNCTGLTSIIIPDSVTSIGDYAFNGCSGLTSVTFGTSVKSIYQYAFFGCIKLASIRIPDSVTSITDNAIPEAVDIYGFTGSEAERYAKKTGNNFITIAAKCGDSAYYGIKANALHITGTGAVENYKTQGSVPWYDSAEQIEKIIIDDNVTKIGTYGFYCLNNLQSIICKNKDLEFGKYALNTENGNITVYAKGGTLAEYCQNNNISFTDVNATPELDSFTANRITVKAVDGYEYSKNANSWQTSGVFNNLLPGTEYNIYARNAKLKTYFPGEISEPLTVTTDKAIVSAPPKPVNIRNTDTEITLQPNAAYEYSIDGVNWQKSNIFTGLIHKNTYTFYQRVAETETKYASPPSEPLVIELVKKTVSAPDAPGYKSHTENSITLNANELYEYSIDGENWQKSNVFTGLQKNTVYCFYQRLAETETEYATEASKPLITAIPDKPRILRTTCETITVKRVEGFEYCLDDFVWQDSTTFSMLLEDTDYSVYQRLKAVDGEKTQQITSEATTVITQNNFSYTPGDINGDEKVNNKDLTRLFQHLSKWDVEVNEAALDINGDGKVNNKDLTRLFQYLSKWDVEIF